MFPFLLTQGRHLAISKGILPRSNLGGRSTPVERSDECGKVLWSGLDPVPKGLVAGR